MINRKRKREKLLRILNHDSTLREILLSADSVEEKRGQLRRFLSDMLVATFDDNPAIPPLEWILTRDAIGAFKNILATRSERLAGFSLLEYMNDMIHREDVRDLPEPSSAFFAELNHLLKGVLGKTGIYPDKVPAFHKYEGQRAAKLRSADLSRMARKSNAYLKRYVWGLENEVIRRRSNNKLRILKHFGATELEWDRWKWHTRHIIRDADTLKSMIKLREDEYEAIRLAKQHGIPFGVTPYYLSLMDYESHGDLDRAVRAQVIPPLNYVEKFINQRKQDGYSMDFMLERDTSPIEGITRRYPKIAILKPILTCPQICVYCQRNWEIEDVLTENSIMTKERLQRAISWLESTPEINEVLITGGDPFLLSNERIERLLSRLSRSKHIERIRIGTRTPVTLPQRVTDSLVRTINRFHNPGKREIVIVTHFEHPYEITPQAKEAIQKFRRYGMDIYNQLVYTFYNSRKYEAAALRHKLRLIGVTPYYTFNTKGKEETDDYRVPIARLLQEQKEEGRLMPGTVRTDDIVFNVPGLGKNYLDASQHHDVIAILPNGCRVYEFHPWEKKLSLVDTYIYTDVPIYDYLQRLKEAGEEITDYRSIWYYY